MMALYNEEEGFVDHVGFKVDSIAIKTVVAASRAAQEVTGSF
jgi:hypothetical protein